MPLDEGIAAEGEEDWDGDAEDTTEQVLPEIVAAFICRVIDDIQSGILILSIDYIFHIFLLLLFLKNGDKGTKKVECLIWTASCLAVTQSVS